PHLHAAGLHELPAAQGLLPARRRRPVARGRCAPRRADPQTGRRRTRRAAPDGRLRTAMATQTPPRPAKAPYPKGFKPSADDPHVLVEDDYAFYEPIPPYPPRTEREAEFYTLGDGEMCLNMGPQLPSTHGVLRVVLKLDGERVVDIDPVLGYLHRGVEKLVENADYHQTISQVDPLEYISSLFCEWAPVTAYEQLLDVEVPRR